MKKFYFAAVFGFFLSIFPLMQGVTAETEPMGQRMSFPPSAGVEDISDRDGLNGKGFVFANPNAKKTCGCGTSFST